MASSSSVNGSLNYNLRKKELDIINKNNKVMLKALWEAKPVVNRNDWDRHSRKY